MIFNYLSLKNKYYLNGFDWVMGVIDIIMRKTTGAGNASQVVFMLDTPPDEALFTASLTRFLALFPILGGTIARHYTLTPYWKFREDGKQPPVVLTVTRIGEDGSDGSLMDALSRFINRPFSGNREHLAFHLVYGRGEQCIAMTFDHRLFDARGAESFMNMFQEYLSSGEDSSVAGGVRTTQKLDLRDWKEKFKAGQVVNRKMIALSKETIRGIPINYENGFKGFRHRIVCFDKDEAAKIYDRAFAEAGYLMIMPYLFARVFSTLHPIFVKRGVEGGAYVVPASADVRQAKDIRQELFFNHNSMFFFQVKQEDIADNSRLLTVIKEQMYEQVQSRFPQCLMIASSLIRVAPLWLMHRVFHLPLQGKIASFCFSHVSKCSYSSHDLMGSRITNVFHMPRMPVPPGIGIFFNTFDGRLNATIAWLEGTLSDDEVSYIEEELRGSL
ncbi:MAG TPA: hypothetical protein VN652_03610 [Geobacteraceae bacterium]|nr:hypothetical protein [Geobacteraceae bacterium]